MTRRRWPGCRPSTSALRTMPGPSSSTTTSRYCAPRMLCDGELCARRGCLASLGGDAAIELRTPSLRVVRSRCKPLKNPSQAAENGCNHARLLGKVSGARYRTKSQTTRATSSSARHSWHWSSFATRAQDCAVVPLDRLQHRRLLKRPRRVRHRQVRPVSSRGADVSLSFKQVPEEWPVFSTTLG